MNGTIQIQNPKTGIWENVHVNGLPDPPQPQVIRLPAPKANNHHPLLIGGIILGAIIGLIACLPASVRGWVVLGIIAAVIWAGWTITHEANVQPTIGVTDYAPRAELVKLPTAPRAELVRVPTK